MYKGTNNGYGYVSSASTTGTTRVSSFPTSSVSKTANNVKYVNLNYTGTSSSSRTPTSQATYSALDFRKTSSTSFEPRPPTQRNQMKQVIRPPSTKILPPISPLSDNNQSEVNETSKSLFEVGFKPNKIENWDNIAQPRKPNLYRLLKNMINRHIKPNVQIEIDNVRFNCHMMVLQCYSDFFMEFNNEVLIQLPKEQVTPHAFMMIYEWMLSDRPLLQRDGIVELFNGANFLRINELINQSWICFDSDVLFSEDNAFLLYLEARKYGLESLQQLMLMRVRKFFLTVVASKEFLTLTVKEIIPLLNSNMIGVNTEIEIFLSGVRWLNYDWEDRKQHVLDVIKTVRFNLIPPWFLVAITKTKISNCIEIKRVVSYPEIITLIDNGIFYTTIHLYYGDHPEKFVHFLERYKLNIPMQRQWIFDKLCKYHHRLKCPNFRFITYKGFLEYLEQIQTYGKDYWRNLEVSSDMQCCCAV